MNERRACSVEPRAPLTEAIFVTGAAVRTAMGDSRGEILRRASSTMPLLAPSPALESEAARRAARTARHDESERAAGVDPGDAVDRLHDVELTEDIDARTFACRGGPIGADRAEALLAATLTDVLREAGLDARPWPDALRVRLILGTTLNGMRHLGPYLRGGPPRDAAHLNASSVASIACERCGLPAAGITISTACASGITAVGIGCDLLRAGDADVVIAGGYDPVSEFSHAGFGALRLLARGAPQPFAADREGMRTAEGYALLVLERARNAARRGAKALARVAAVAESSDAFHLTQPRPDGEGAAVAVLEAIALGGAPDLLVAHATGTDANDAAEYHAYDRAFGPALAALPVVAPKAAFGHTLGAAGAVDAALCIAMAESQSIMPTGGADDSIDREAFPSLALVRTATPLRIRRTMNVALGFGGSNAALVLDHDPLREDERAAEPSTARAADRNGERAPAGARECASAAEAAAVEDLVVTGWSAVVPGGAGAGDAVASLADVRPGEITDDELAPYLDVRAARRIAPASRLVRAAVRLAVEDARLEPALVAQSTACCASQHGAIGYSVAAYREVVAGGLGAGNPLLFAESVPNVPGAQCSLAFGLRGAAITVIGSRVGFIEALLMARARLRAKRTDRVIVIAADEQNDVLDVVLASWKQARRGRAETAAGAVALVLERRHEALRRGATLRARLGAIAWEAPRERRSRALLAAAERVAARLSGALDAPARPGLLGRLERRAAGARLGAVLGAEMNAVGPALLAVTRAARGERAAVLALDPFAQAGGFELLPVERGSGGAV